MAERFYHYGAFLEGIHTWVAGTIGGTQSEPAVTIPMYGGELPLLGTWDHEPTDAEIQAVTPWKYRTIESQSLQVEGQTRSEMAEKLLIEAWARGEIEMVGENNLGQTLFRFTV